MVERVRYSITHLVRNAHIQYRHHELPMRHTKSLCLNIRNSLIFNYKNRSNFWSFFRGLPERVRNVEIDIFAKKFVHITIFGKVQLQQYFSKEM